MSTNLQPVADRSKRTMKFLLVGVVGFNLLLMAISLTSWFGGTERSPGVADQIFGKVRLGGFRGDFAWLVASTAVLFLVLFVFITQARQSRAARISAALCVAEVLAFGLYLFHSLTSGILYFG
jgi:hypothetical protein